MRLSDLKDISKQQLTEKVKTFTTPAYVDLKNNCAVIRFKTREEAKRFESSQTLAT